MIVKDYRDYESVETYYNAVEYGVWCYGLDPFATELEVAVSDYGDFLDVLVSNQNTIEEFEHVIPSRVPESHTDFYVWYDGEIIGRGTGHNDSEWILSLAKILNDWKVG